MHDLRELDARRAHEFTEPAPVEPLGVCRICRRTADTNREEAIAGFNCRTHAAEDVANMAMRMQRLQQSACGHVRPAVVIRIVHDHKSSRSHRCRVIGTRDLLKLGNSIEQRARTCGTFRLGPKCHLRPEHMDNAVGQAHGIKRAKRPVQTISDLFANATRSCCHNRQSQRQRLCNSHAPGLGIRR